MNAQRLFSLVIFLSAAVAVAGAPDHAWVWIDMGKGETILAFTYVDTSAGPSAKGIVTAKSLTAAQAKKAASSPDHTVRLAPSFPTTALTPEELKRLKLPAKPEWLRFFATPEVIAAPWKKDPKLKLHADYPNDVEARFYFPAERKVESMWVSLSGVDQEIGGYTGKLLNTPNSKAEVRAGSIVSIRSSPGVPEPVWVSPVMRENLKKWTMKCTACAFDMYFTPLEDVAKAQFPNAPPGAEMLGFTTACPVCGKLMNVDARTPKK
jgi:hypothetical protein